MLKCCISACGKDRSSSNELKFFRIPSRHQVNRRRLWRQAIQRANGGTGEVNGSARVCGDHFLSGVASDDPDSPDFVPSVFGSREIIKARRNRRRKGRHRADVRREEMKSPPQAETPVEDKPPALMETEFELPQEISPPSPSLKEAETLTPLPGAATAATEDNTESLSPNQTSLSLTKKTIMADMDRVRPVVLLKRVVVPQESFLCEMCSEEFSDESKFNKHQQLHEESCELSDEADVVQQHDAQPDELSFPCNICGRCYPSAHLLKRHKLLHVRDNRKCSTCGVMFCRRHNHMIFNPAAVAAVVPKIEEDSAASEPDIEGRTIEERTVEERTIEERTIEERTIEERTIEERTIEDIQPEVSEQSQTDDRQEKAPTVTPMQIINAAPATQRPDCSPNTVRQRPLLPKPNTEPTEERRPQTVPPSPPSPEPYFQDAEFPGSLKMFSPQYLTSALLDVKRNYQYIFSKSKHVETSAMKVEPQSVNSGAGVQPRARKELIAYDIEIEI